MPSSVPSTVPSFPGQGLYLRRIGGNGIGGLPEFGTGDPLHRLKTVRPFPTSSALLRRFPKAVPGLTIHGLGRSLQQALPLGAIGGMSLQDYLYQPRGARRRPSKEDGGAGT